MSKGVRGGVDLSGVAEWVLACRWDEVCVVSKAWITWGGMVRQEQELFD